MWVFLDNLLYFTDKLKYFLHQPFRISVLWMFILPTKDIGWDSVQGTPKTNLYVNCFKVLVMVKWNLVNIAKKDRAIQLTLKWLTCHQLSGSSLLTVFITSPRSEIQCLNTGSWSHFRYPWPPVKLVSHLLVAHECHEESRVFQMALEECFQATKLHIGDLKFGREAAHATLPSWGPRFEEFMLNNRK